MDEEETKLFGSLKDLVPRRMIQQQRVVKPEVVKKAVYVEKTAEEIKWQTESLRDTILSIGQRYTKFRVPLQDAKDITKEEAHLAKEFLPHVDLVGLELHSERRSRAWGGFYFRVLADANDQKRCIQYMYIWTLQKWFVSFWYSVLPPFILGILATFIFSFLAFRQALVSITIIGAIFFLTGIWNSASTLFRQKKFYYTNAMLFILYGVIFWFLAAEMYIFKPKVEFEPIPPEDLVPGDIPIDPHEVRFSVQRRELRFSIIGVLFILIAVISLLILLFQPKGTAASHTMDYAPLYVYLRKSDNGWTLDGIRYDAFHYFCDTAGSEFLEKNHYVTKDGRPRLAIDNNWHSFKLDNGKNIYWASIGLLGFIFSLVLWFYSLFIAPDGTFFGQRVVRFVYFPLIAFAFAYAFFSKAPYPIINRNKITFNDPIYHLTYDKILIFWNLASEEPALKIRQKLQNPFMLDPDYWTTFRDDLEELIWFNVFPRLEKLEQKIT